MGRNWIKNGETKTCIALSQGKTQRQL